MEFIELRLFWDGLVNRQDLVQTFGVSLQQASADFARYLEIAPANTAYDRSAKGYVRSSDFSPKIAKPDASRYLAGLRLIGDGIAAADALDFTVPPEFDLVPGPTRRIEAGVLRAILAAIRQHLEIEVEYQSMSRPEPERRWIGPHALAWDGFRWHARSWCPRARSFRDFVIARMSELGDTRAREWQSSADRAWHERVRVILGPHPDLSEGQRKAIEADYSMTGGVSVIDVRICFLWYFLKRFGLGGDQEVKAPHDQHIVLLNRNDVLSALTDRPDV